MRNQILFQMLSFSPLSVIYFPCYLNDTMTNDLYDPKLIIKPFLGTTTIHNFLNVEHLLNIDFVSMIITVIMDILSNKKQLQN